jgi:hypothetical protein
MTVIPPRPDQVRLCSAGDLSSPRSSRVFDESPIRSASSAVYERRYLHGAHDRVIGVPRCLQKLPARGGRGQRSETAHC